MSKLNQFEEILKFVRRSDFSIRSKQQMLEIGFAEYTNLNIWKVIGITKSCIDALIEADFNYIKVKPVRSHIYQRRETFLNVINSDMGAQESLDYIFEKDVAILSLRSENKDDNSLTSFFDINPQDGYFPSTIMGYRFHKKHEVPFLKTLCELNGYKY